MVGQYTTHLGGPSGPACGQRFTHEGLTEIGNIVGVTCRRCLATVRAESVPQDKVVALKDEDGHDVQVIYEVKLSYVVSAVCPCSKKELAALVMDRISAAGGVMKLDIDKATIIGVERI